MMDADLVYRIAEQIRRLALDRGRDPFTATVELLVLMNPVEMKAWADSGFPSNPK